MQNENIFNKFFEKRVCICFFILMLLLLSCILRITVIANSSFSKAQAEQSQYRITVSQPRGTVFDRNMLRLNNTEKKIIAAVSPTPRAVMGISSLLEGEELERVLEDLKKGVPAICEVKEKLECDGISYTEIYQHTPSGNTASHIIGYTDNQNHGISGLEAAYDSLLYGEGTVDAVYTVDGKGSLLGGIEPHFENNSSVTGNGIVTTLDINIQDAAEAAAEGIEKGAVIVSECENAKIRAMVSRPGFEISNISKYLNSDDSPLLNRALCAYSVGSVFKPCTAAAALENKMGDFTHTCSGSTFIIDRYFNCHNRAGHGDMSLKDALAFSCNSYFYNLAIGTGADSVYKKARSLSFGSSLKIADGISTSNGSIIKKDSLDNPAALANLSIGQGDLSVSPVGMLNLYNAIANKGRYYLPSVVEKTLENGKISDYNIGSPTEVMQENTADIIKNYLSSVITEGTGTAAAPKLCTAAGKTATAQTGRYDQSGKEITNSWFCGFFPLEAPKYTVIVMSEGKSSVSTAAVFAQLADSITRLELSNG